LGVDVVADRPGQEGAVDVLLGIDQVQRAHLQFGEGPLDELGTQGRILHHHLKDQIAGDRFGLPSLPESAGRGLELRQTGYHNMTS
ncbi:hypothetical protein, partial [Limosilactobacillus ingluviei]|uniref:hypothetical protein n=1 Tax=Limosilactobacillus ingluviei TaxID=148604 RepID=UPI0024BA769A